MIDRRSVIYSILLYELTQRGKNFQNYCLEKEKNHQYSETMDKRIKMLQRTIEAALIEHGQYGDSSEEGRQP